MPFCLSRLEFSDLWHKLKVPNKVDLLKELASGRSFNLPVRIPLKPCPALVLFRGSPSYCCRASRTEGARSQEKGQEVWCTKSARETHKHALAGHGHRLEQRLCGAWKVDFVRGRCDYRWPPVQALDMDIAVLKRLL